MCCSLEILKGLSFVDSELLHGEPWVYRLLTVFPGVPVRIIYLNSKQEI